MKLLSIIACCLFCSTSFAGLSPASANEFCPKTNIQFTFTVSGNQNGFYFSDNVYTNGAISSTSYSSFTNITTVSLTLYFGDISLRHSIRINYTDGYTPTYEVFVFDKIKSLYGYSDVPSLNINTITVDSCSISTTSISFAKLKWKNFTTSPATEFGEISEYEYSVPAGWKVDGSLSTGPSDIKVGTNTAMIEADIVQNGQIIIRPANKCASGLVNGGNTAVVNIARTKPHLTFTSVQKICSPSTFQANNLPSWVTSFQWAVTPSTTFSFSNANANPTVISNNGSVKADLSLAISGSSCPASFSYNTMEIIGATMLFGGTPLVTTGLAPYVSAGDENGVCFNVENYIPCVTTGYSSAGYPSWTYVSQSGSPQPSWGGTDQDIYVYFFNSHQSSLVLQLNASNECGTTSYQFGFKPITCASLTKPPNKYQISPNPTKNMINVYKKPNETGTLTNKTTDDLRITRVSVYDLQNTLRLTKSFNYVNTASVSLANLGKGHYFVIITSPSVTETQQVIVQ